MCEELKLIQTHLGIWKLEDWTIPVASVQLYGVSKSVYCIKNKINNKLLIGEGGLSSNNGTSGARILYHINGHYGHSNNQGWLSDLKLYGKDAFCLNWIIPEENENKRKLMEYKLQTYFKDNCYNRPRKKYPTQKELQIAQHGKIIDRLNNYTIVNRGYKTKCWESNFIDYHNNKGYKRIGFNKKTYGHHVLMYIYHNGDICGITSILHHKCENKSCVNPKHLELVTHTENINIHFNCKNVKNEVLKLHKNGLSTSEIAKEINITINCVCKYIKREYSSNYHGVYYDDKFECFKACCQIDKKTSHLGTYNSEIEAAKNRDYYIVKNNFLGMKHGKLNFHDVDYNDFKPFLCRNGKFCKNIESLIY